MNDKSNQDRHQWPTGHDVMMLGSLLASPSQNPGVGYTGLAWLTCLAELAWLVGLAGLWLAVQAGLQPFARLLSGKNNKKKRHQIHKKLIFIVKIKVSWPKSLKFHLKHKVFWTSIALVLCFK